ncbi:unnamed protein product [Dovyalis caffra]|uniref:Uncharacterized protein n=1 Tax=Dovyalis caffra TaxID=77055 RepID=A0AAV1R334_9ROSI|nr:unnamed protein product [Dovyalis caffra]
MEITPSVTEEEPLNLNAIRSRISELEEIYRNSNEDSFSEMPSYDSDELMKDSAHQLVSKVDQMLTDYSDFSFLGIEDLDSYLAHLKEELNEAEAESAKISNEIEFLNRTYREDSSELESDLEWMKCSLDLISAQQDIEEEKEGTQMERLSSGDNQSILINTHEEDKFELRVSVVMHLKTLEYNTSPILKLDNQIEKSKKILKSMEDLDSVFKRFDAIERIEDVLSGLKVIEIDGTCIRLSMRTYIPKQEDLLCQQKFEETSEPSEVNHEFLIEVTDESMEIKKAEMFPNDIYIGDIVDAAKSFRQIFLQLELMETSSSLEWFVRKAQDRIIQCTLRRLVAKSASTSRQSIEYLDKDEIIVAHLVGGVDAFMKVSHGWPITNFPLKLVSLKSSNHHSKEISLAFLCKVEEVANSLDVQTRQNLSSFVDAVEKILVEQMRLALHSDGASSI